MESPQIESFSEIMAQAEELERKKGEITDEVMALRMLAKKNYPAEFAAYLRNKTNKAGSAGETIHANFWGKQRIDDLKHKRPIKF